MYKYLHLLRKMFSCNVLNAWLFAFIFFRDNEIFVPSNFNKQFFCLFIHFSYKYTIQVQFECNSYQKLCLITRTTYIYVYITQVVRIYAFLPYTHIHMYENLKNSTSHISQCIHYLFRLLYTCIRYVSRKTCFHVCLYVRQDLNAYIHTY